MAKTFSVGVIISAVDRASVVFGRVQRAGEAFHKTIGGTVQTVAKLGAYTTAAVGAIGALGAKLVSDYTETAGALRDLSGQIGWGVEALQSWTYAASQAGVESSAFQSALQVLARNMGNLHGKSGPLFKLLATRAPRVLAQLDKAKDPAEALDILVRSMEAIEDPTKRAAFAAAAFGKGGAAIQRLAVEGSPALARLREESKRLGLVMSKDDVDAAEAFGDNLDRVKLQVLGVGRSIAAALVPSLDSGVQSFSAWIQANRAAITGKVVETIQAVGAWLRSVDWTGIGQSLLSVASGIATVAGAAPVLLAIFAGVKLTAGIASAAAAFQGLAGAAALGSAPILAIGAAVAAVGVAIWQAISAYREWKSLEEHEQTMRGADASVYDWGRKRTGAASWWDLAAAGAEGIRRRRETRAAAAADGIDIRGLTARDADRLLAARRGEDARSLLLAPDVSAPSGTVEVHVHVDGPPGTRTERPVARGRGVSARTATRTAPTGRRRVGMLPAEVTP